MLETSEGYTESVMFSQKIDGFVQDLRIQQLRALLLSVIEKERADMREMCVRILFRVGMIFASPEDLLLAA